MNEETSSSRQSQVTNELQQLEKTIEELSVVAKSLNQRLEPITMEQKESFEKTGIPQAPLCGMAQKIRNIKERIRDEIYYLEDLKKRIEL